MKILAQGDRSREFLATIGNLFPSRFHELRDLMHAPDGILVVIERVTPMHSDQQRAYYWSQLKRWGDDMGYSARESEVYLHPALLVEAFGLEKSVMFLGRRIDIPRLRSSRLNKEDYSQLIDTMIRIAAEHGYVIEPPMRMA